MAITPKPSSRRPGIESGNDADGGSTRARRSGDWAVAGSRDETSVQELPSLDEKPGSVRPQSAGNQPQAASGSRDETAVLDLPSLDGKPGSVRPHADGQPRPPGRHDSPPPRAHSSPGYAVASPNEPTPPPGSLPVAATAPTSRHAVSKPAITGDGIPTSEIPVAHDPQQADPVAMRGAYSRAEGRQEHAEPEAASAANSPAQRRFTIVAGPLIALLVFAVFYKIISSVGDEPTEAELKLLYPYGFTGAKSAHGEVAPPASAVRFYFKGKEACSENGGPKVCLLYEYTCGDFFGTMLVKNTSTGWQRVSDAGMPFRPVTGSSRR